MSTITFKPTFRPQTRQISAPRLGRTHLSVHAVTNWILEPKKGGQSVNLTESIAKKQTAYVKSGGGDFVRPSLNTQSPVQPSCANYRASINEALCVV